VSESPKKSIITRRSFAVGAAVAATAALIQPSEALTPQEAAKPASPLAQQAQAALAKLSPKSRAEVQMKMDEIIRKYGDQLSEEQRADILKIMAEGQSGLETMRAFALTNADQPADVLELYRGEKA
jgi:low affinity Fe/Cu permease